MGFFWNAISVPITLLWKHMYDPNWSRYNRNTYAHIDMLATMTTATPTTQIITLTNYRCKPSAIPLGRKVLKNSGLTDRGILVLASLIHLMLLDETLLPAVKKLHNTTTVFIQTAPNVGCCCCCSVHSSDLLQRGANVQGQTAGFGWDPPTR